MNRLALLKTVIVLLASSQAIANCALGPQLPSPELTEAERERRGKIFLAMCMANDGDLVDSHDASIQERIVRPSEPLMPNGGKDLYPAALQKRRLEGVVRIGFEIDESGKITRLAILSTSGHKELDDLTMEIYARTSFKNPLLLDGKPRRAYISIRTAYSLND